MFSNLARLVSSVLASLAAVMLVLTALNLLLSFEIVSPSALPFSYGTYLKTVGVACLVASLLQFLEGGWMRWWFAIIFGMVALRVFFPEHELPIAYPTSPEGKFGFAVMSTILAFGGMQLMNKAEHWKLKVQAR